MRLFEIPPWVHMERKHGSESGPCILSLTSCQETLYLTSPLLQIKRECEVPGVVRWKSKKRVLSYSRELVLARCCSGLHFEPQRNHLGPPLAVPGPLAVAFPSAIPNTGPG